MLKRIFEERRYVVAAVGGLIVVQGIIFTLIDVGCLSFLMTMVGLAAVVGGLNVEAVPLLTRMAEKSPMPKAGKDDRWYGFHDLRRGFATVNAASMDLFELQALMQHRSLTTTQGYV